jgi:uncharacterized membrane protein YcaP (DUF421 family)
MDLSDLADARRTRLPHRGPSSAGFETRHHRGEESMELTGVDWRALIEPDVPILESVVRGTILYFFVFILMRGTLRRTAGELSMIDFIFVLLVANGAADSMTGGAVSITGGIVVILTIVAWNYALNSLSWYVPPLQRWTTPPPLQVVDNGKLLRRNMRKEFLTEDELMGQLREEGVEDLSSVKAAHIEGDGNISVILHDPA